MFSDGVFHLNLEVKISQFPVSNFQLELPPELDYSLNLDLKTQLRTLDCYETTD